MNDETICIELTMGFEFCSNDDYISNNKDKCEFTRLIIEAYKKWDSDDEYEFLKFHCNEILNSTSKINDLSNMIGEHNAQHIKSIKIIKKKSDFHVIKIIIDKKDFDLLGEKSIQDFEKKIFDLGYSAEASEKNKLTKLKNVSSLWSICTDYFHVSNFLDEQIGYTHAFDVKVG